ncbi:MAG TPA: ABC transporter permease [Bryobacteraceae bacterium]|jgi:putative ABC transport system permease protein|nr:ABC transporter permease [Bryobacteraceae bacterium]
MAQTASFREAAAVAADSLRSSKLRSFLTLLGIILATTTLIAVMSIIHGMDLYIADSVSNMGSDGFRIVRIAFLGNFDPKKFLEMQKKNPQLSPDEFNYLKSKVTLTKELGMAAGRGASVSLGTQTLSSIGLNGGTSNWIVLGNTQLASGRYFTEIEDTHHATVAVLGADVKNNLFGDSDAIGKTIKIEGRPFTVIGVAVAKGSVFGQSQDAFVDIPVQTYFQIYSAHQGINYAARALDQSVLEQSKDEIRMLLRVHRHLRPGQDDNFSVISSDALVGAWDRLTGAIAGTAIAVVSVFMVVGGVVIMNIMLAAVTERTHEIGIRKSVGARRQDILNQFLVESSMLAGIGGLIGVLLAWMAALLVRTATPVPMAVPASAVALGVTLSVAVGLFFGIYPAQRASKLDPIEALRVER